MQIRGVNRKGDIKRNKLASSALTFLHLIATNFLSFISFATISKSKSQSPRITCGQNRRPRIIRQSTNKTTKSFALDGHQIPWLRLRRPRESNTPENQIGDVFFFAPRPPKSQTNLKPDPDGS